MVRDLFVSVLASSLEKEKYQLQDRKYVGIYLLNYKWLQMVTNGRQPEPLLSIKGCTQHSELSLVTDSKLLT